ncbi:Replicative DNA helicase intein-containing [Rhodococcus wratislaviensis]|uniref:Replicative DNA helicase intein-containing n=1 Tax=Rhodococcus wratislaviensis TaxID=44752 RepID=A0A402BZH7_RHOWR|nr:LAGLIDADG family homing endonuclease [Rhodococcus wratislaviensis]GCE36741.1 Replicative DNA helicase intein-containing [Rhodococcus wratislaviensis]
MADVLRVHLASGRQIELSRDQEFRAVTGWIPLRELEIGQRLAIPRYIPEPIHGTRLADAEIILLAHMIGDGSCVKRQPIRYASIDEENLAAVATAATHFGVTAIRDEYAAARCITLRLPAPYRLGHGKRNPIAAWLDELGLFGLRSYEKFVPKVIFDAGNDQVALFLRHLWATDGSVRWDEKGNQGRVYYGSTSRRLVDDVAMLLLRIGVHGRIKRVRKAGYRDCWHLRIDGVQNQTQFLSVAGVHGSRGESARRVLRELLSLAHNTNVDTIPKEIWVRVREILASDGVSHRIFASAMNIEYCGSTLWKHGVSRSRLAKVAEFLDDDGLRVLATSDVFWDRVVDIVSAGAREVFTCPVLGADNLVVDGIVVRQAQQ